MKLTKDVIEKLAWYEHDGWSRWMKYLFSKCSYDVHGNACIPREFWERWQRQMETDYNDLSEKEKESDRMEVLYIVPILETFLETIEMALTSKPQPKARKKRTPVQYESNTSDSNSTT